jgi:hypothetical protein
MGFPSSTPLPLAVILLLLAGLPIQAIDLDHDGIDDL